MDSETEQPESEAQETRTPAAPWYQRVLPVTGVLLLVLALAAVVPPFRDQLKLSLSRQSQEYVALYFSRPADAQPQMTCLRKGSSVWVRFTIASHLEDRQTAKYVVWVNPEGRSRTLRKSGAVPVTPGAPVEEIKKFRVPRKQDYLVSVVLPGLDQQIRARCPGGR